MRESSLENIDYKNKIQNILYDNYIKLALVNLDTGEYVSIINVDGNADDYDNIEDVSSYFAKNRGLECCHPDEVGEFAYMCDMKNVKALVESGARTIVRNFRFRLMTGADYEWVAMDIEAEKEPRADGQWVVFGMKTVCPDTLVLEDSIRTLTRAYRRIFRIDVTHNICETLRGGYIRNKDEVKRNSFNDYMNDLVIGGEIFPDDVDKVKKCLSPENLTKYFANGHDRFTIRYKRKMDMVFRWVMTEVIPTADYREDNKVFYLYTRDIHEEYTERIERQELLEFYSYKDALTHLGNRNSFNILCDAYAVRADKPSVGFIFNDVNKLKYVNDHFGHKEGDLYLQRVSQMLAQQFGENACYRISGDEFVVVIMDVSEQTFNSIVARYKNLIDEQDEAPVAFGAVWKAEPDTIDQIMNEAERRMYEDKKRFYAKHPEVKRRESVEKEAGIAVGHADGEVPHYRNLGKTDRIFDALAATTIRNYIFMSDLETNVTKWSASAVDYFGLPGQYIYDTKSVWESLIHPEDRAVFEQDIDAVFAGRKKYHDVEYRMRNKKGEYVVCTCRGFITKKENGDPEFFVGTVINHGVIDGVDPVTNLHNQQEYTKYITHHLSNKQTMSIMTIGISMFNSINMMYGYAYGNSVLRDFAVKLKNIVGGRGLIFRLDGAKFAICSNVYTRQEMQDVYRHIQNVALENVGPIGTSIPLKLYAGALVYDHLGANTDVIKSSVEYATERSKEDNHGDLVFFNEQIKDNDRLRLKMYSTIHKCVMNNMEGFFMCYQPIANSKTGQIVGMEALLRWKHMDFGVVPPGVFIPWLEMEPCFFELGNWIIERSLRDAMEIRKMRPDFVVNVNISATQLENHGFRQTVTDILNRTKFPPECLCMELTERCKNMDIEFLKCELDFFRKLGIKIAIDDFGTGNATLNLLTELPIDELKVDMSFVRGIQESKPNQVLVQAVVSCANQLGYKSCIEGVEDKALFEYLHRYGSTYYQGYHFSKPVTLDEFKKLL